eukprot:1676771-Rhodomonas_salina.2
MLLCNVHLESGLGFCCLHRVDDRAMKLRQVPTSPVRHPQLAFRGGTNRPPTHPQLLHLPPPAKNDTLCSSVCRAHGGA